MFTKHFSPWAFCLIASSLCFASPLHSQTMANSVETADVIAIARTVSFVQDEKQAAELKKEKAEKRVYRNNDIYKMFRRMWPKGIYKLQLVKTVKGNCDANFDLFTLATGSKLGTEVLLLMKKDADGKLHVVEEDAAPIVLGELDESSTRKAIEGSPTPLQSVVDLVLLSLKDPPLRARNIGLVRNIVDPKMVSALAPYLSDPDQGVRNDVLYNLSLNQQVAAIPLIVADLRKDTSGYGGPSVMALQQLEVPEAVPYLNPLLFESKAYLRYSAVQALRNIINAAYNSRKPFDRSSVPYLVLALRDPKPDQDVSLQAFASLQLMISTNGVVDYDAFRNKPEEETRKLFDWWRDELSSKHPRELMPGESAPVAKTIPANLDTMSKADAIAALSPLLFEMSAYTRRRAIDQLQTRADLSSVPYLLLACEDPNFDIAYKAYTTLHRLLPTTGATVSRPSFVADRDAANKSLYAWWQDELLDKHSVEGSKRWQRDQEDQKRVEALRKSKEKTTSTDKPSTDKTATSSTR